jgi:hypothetical protein
MVAKINIGSSLYGALAYNGEKINQEKGKLLVTNKVFDDGTGKMDIHRAIEDFKRYMPLQVRTEKPVIHISLNPHPEDQLSDVELADIAREYMEKLGYGNQPYMVYKHEDINRHHLHIVSIRVDENGKCLNNAYNFHRSKSITREIEKKYGLHTAERQRTTKAEPVRKVDLSDGNIKKQVGNVVKSLMHYQFQSLSEFRALLSLYNVTVEETQGQAHEKEYRGLIYCATDGKGNKIGNPFKSSVLGKAVGYDALERQMAFSKKQFQEKKQTIQTRHTIATILQQTLNQKEFVEQLKAKGIDTVFRKTDTGRIYGATFIDHTTAYVFNGSRLGKKFSANALQEHFAATSTNIDCSKAIKANQPERSQDDSSLPNDFSDNNQGIFSFESHGADIEEEAFARSMRRKKKRKQHRNI